MKGFVGSFARWGSFALTGFESGAALWAWIFNVDHALEANGVRTLFRSKSWTPKMWTPFFTACSVDESTVTTFLAFATLLGCLRATWDLARNKPRPALDDAPRYPFGRRAEVYYLAAGLAGTLLGMIIALLPRAAGSIQNPEDRLLGGLNAALISTLSAVVLVYFVHPLPEWLFRRWVPCVEGDSLKRPFDPLRQLRRILRRMFAEASSLLDALAILKVCVEDISRATTIAAEGFRTFAREAAKREDVLSLKVGELVRLLTEANQVRKEESQTIRALLEDQKAARAAIDARVLALEEQNRALAVQVQQWAERDQRKDSTLRRLKDTLDEVLDEHVSVVPRAPANGRA